MEAEGGKQSSSGLEWKLHPVRSHALHALGFRFGTLWSPWPRSRQIISGEPHASPPPALLPAPQLVLINISDHHTRTRANTPGASAAGVAPPAVMGCLLGSQSGRTVDISNSFEIKYSTSAGQVEVDVAFLLKKQEQCKRVYVWHMAGAGGGGGPTTRQLAVHRAVAAVGPIQIHPHSSWGCLSQ